VEASKVHAGEHQAEIRDTQVELHRRDPCSGMEHQRDVGSQLLTVTGGDASVEEGHPGRSLERGERDVEQGQPVALERAERSMDRTDRDVAEDEIGETSP
jgi:hypothetical protein